MIVMIRNADPRAPRGARTGLLNEGQPVPLSNLSSEAKSGSPDTAPHLRESSSALPQKRSDHVILFRESSASGSKVSTRTHYMKSSVPVPRATDCQPIRRQCGRAPVWARGAPQPSPGVVVREARRGAPPERGLRRALERHRPRHRRQLPSAPDRQRLVRTDKRMLSSG